jgi:hypothetical protein
VDFNTVILEEVVPQLRTIGFVITEKHKMPGFVQLQRDIILVTFAYNPLDYEKMFSLGTVDGQEYILDDDILRNVFQSQIKITDVSLDQFVESVILFIETCLNDLFVGDDSKMQEIARYAEHRNHVYTQELLKSQVVQQ